MIKFINLKDSNGSPIFGQPLLDTVYNINLPADTVASLTVPQSPDACIISATDHFIVSERSDISLTISPTFEIASGMLNQAIIQLKNLRGQEPFIVPDTLYFIAPAQCIIYVGFFSIT